MTVGGGTEGETFNNMISSAHIDILRTAMSIIEEIIEITG